MGNPALFPLIYSCQSRDILVVHVNPIERPDKPTSAGDIMNRVNEISFNSSLMREMRAIAFVTKLIDDGKLSQGDAKRMLVHSVCADDVMRGLGTASKLNADGGFLRQLRALGRERAQPPRPCAQQNSAPHVRFGSEADIFGLRHVRFTPESGHSTA
jgi:NTE family protein